MKSFSNAFELLTDDADEIKLYTMRSNMMNAIADIIESKSWTQKEAAKFLGVTQPRISSLKNGEIGKFSVGMLMDMLSKLGFNFDFKYTTPSRTTSFSMSMTVSEKQKAYA